MAARRKSAGKKARSKRSGKRASREELAQRKRRRKTPLKPKKQPRRKKKTTPKPKKKALRRLKEKPLPPAPPPPKRKARKAPPPPKRKSRKPPPLPKLTRVAVRRLSAAQKAAITRAATAFGKFPPLRPHTRAVDREKYTSKRAALVLALQKAGYSPASIRARLGWITRRQNIDRQRIAALREIILGTEFLHGANSEDLVTLKAMVRENDRRYARFLAVAEDEGLTHQEAVNEWFSPKIQGE